MAKKKNETIMEAESKLVQKYLTITLADGSKKQLKFRGKTDEEAQAKLEKAKREHDMGLLTLDGDMLFSKWAKEYLETFVKPKQSKLVYADCVFYVNKVFIDQIGSMKMRNIRTTHLQQCINLLEGKSKSYIDKCMIIIKRIFKKAMIEGIIVRNPAMGMETPAGLANGKRRALTDDERGIFFKVLDKYPNGAIFSVMIGCGLRPGEARALAWTNVDLEEKTITVNCAIKREGIVGEPKSEAGNRTIPMPDWLVHFLKGQQKKNSLLVFPGEDSGVLGRVALDKRWHTFLRRMDIEGGAKTENKKIVLHSPVIGWDVLTAYYLRHTYATSLAEAGVAMKTAQYLLGHAKIEMTANIYTHVTTKMVDNVYAKINTHHNAKMARDSGQTDTEQTFTEIGQ